MNTLHLSELLAGLTTKDLHEIRRTLAIPNASQLNKTDLIAKLTKEMPLRISNQLLLLDSRRFQIIEKVLKHGGTIHEEELFDHFDYNPIYFENRGLLFEIDAQIFMPLEIIATIKTLDQKIFKAMLKRNTEWTKLTEGMLFFYGVLDSSTLIEKVTYYTGHPVDKMDFVQVLSDYISYNEGIFYDPDYGYCYFLVDDPAYINNEHRARASVDYYPFKKNELLRAANEDYVDRHPYHQQLVRFLTNKWDINESNAEFILEEIVIAIQMDFTPSELVGKLQEELDFQKHKMETIQQLIDLLMNFYNYTRQWVLKGYSPAELRKITNQQGQSEEEASSGGAEVYHFQTKKKIGRNDPCPCGSGKKFKRCCGA